MKKITHEELKQIQLGILDNIHEFCEKHGLAYFLSSGTLIGAVRHKGYIPWDDDLDIYMLRPDYDKFVRKFSENPPENTRLRALENCPEYQYAFAKVIDARTVLIEKAFGEKFELGVYVDVFPLESVPDKPLFFLLWFGILTKLKRLSSLALEARLRKTKFFSNAKTPLRKIIKFAFYPLARAISYRVYLRIYDAIAKRHNAHSKYVYNMSCGAGIHTCFRRSAISGTTNIEFEGKTYKTMIGYKEYLYATYGDFTQLPPAEKQISNHDFVVHWK